MSSEYAEFFEEFMEESRDHLSTMNLSLLEIEKEKANPSKEHIDNLFRAAHTVKGLSGMMEFGSVEALCHAVEDLMDLVRNGKFNLDDTSFQVLFTSLDILETLLNELAQSKTTETPVDDLISEIKACIDGEGSRKQPSSSSTPSAAQHGQAVSVDFDYNFDEFVISEIEKLKIEGAVKANRFIYEITADLQGGTHLEDLEELPFIENYTDIGTILLFSPPLREIETANGSIKTIILVATELNEQQFAAEVSESFELIRRGKEVVAPAQGDPVQEPHIQESTAAVEEPPLEASPETTGTKESSFVKIDYSNVAFCDDVSLVDTDILEGYNADVEELIESLDLALIDLENKPEDMDTINSVFRIAHTIKGTSAMFGFSRVVELTHRLENLFDDIRKEKIKIDAGIMDIVFASIDKLRLCLDEIKNLEDSNIDITDEVNRLARFMEGHPTGTPSTSGAAAGRVKTEEFTAEGFHLNDTNNRLIEEALTQGKRLFTLGISFKDDVMTSSFDPMNIFMILEMVGDLITTALDISHVPAFNEFDAEKFYLKYKYLITSDQSEEDIKATFSAMEQVVVDSLEDVTPDTVKSARQEAPAPTTPQEEPAPQAVKAETAPETAMVPPTPAPQKTEAKPAPAPMSAPKTPAITAAQKKEQAAGKLAAKSATTIRVDIERLDKLLNLVGEFVIDRTRYTQIGEDLKREHPNSPHAKMLSETNMLFGRHMNEIQDVIMSVRMVPIGNAFNKFPRVVRDLARTLEKEIDLVLFGEETELDKTLVEEIGDPLVHLVRNSVDHGIEMPDEREAKGKPRVGTIKMSAFQEGNNIVIEIEDDGGGINKEKILEKAVERGLIEEGAQLADKEIFNLIFEPGFSTAAVVSNVSGRGVGMDVVRKNIENLKGIIDIQSELGVGSTITIKLPLTLAIVQTLVVTCGTELLAIPLSSVIETVRIEPDEVKILQGKEMINLRDNVLPLMNLSDFYGFESPPKEVETRRRKGRKNKRKRLFVVIVGLAEKRLGLVVNSLKTQQEIVIKSIGKLLSNAMGISGGTIMGDGNVVLIVDVAEVMHNADKVKTSIIKKEAEQEEHQAKTILLYNKSQKVLNSMKDFLEEYDLVISRSEEDLSKKLNYYDIDLVIAGHQENFDVTWKQALKKNTKKKAPIIFLAEKDILAKKGRNRRNEVYLPETVDRASLLGQIDKLL